MYIYICVCVCVCVYACFIEIIEQVLEAIPHKTAAVRPRITHHENY